MIQSIIWEFNGTVIPIEYNCLFYTNSVKIQIRIQAVQKWNQKAEKNHQHGPDNKL